MSASQYSGFIYHDLATAIEAAQYKADTQQATFHICKCDLCADTTSFIVSSVWETYCKSTDDIYLSIKPLSDPELLGSA